jgi:hypothetical protein
MLYDDDDYCPPTYLVLDTTLRSRHTDYPIPWPHRSQSLLSSNHIRRLSIILSATAPAHVICRSSSFVPMFRFSPSHWTHVSSLAAPHSRTHPLPALSIPPYPLSFASCAASWIQHGNVHIYRSVHRLYLRISLVHRLPRSSPEPKKLLSTTSYCLSLGCRSP